MANIPNSGRYRTIGHRKVAKRTSASGASSWSTSHASGSAGNAHQSTSGNHRPNSGGGDWFWIIVLLVLLIAFRVPALSLLALLVFAIWFMAKK